MSPPMLDMQALQTLRSQYSQALKDFAASQSAFKVLQTIPATSPPSSTPIRTLFVLDSSFNPPSKAHSSLVKTALKPSDPIPHTVSPRVLLLLATVNADKKPKPADFEDRLVMMTLMAEDLRSSFSHASSAQSTSTSTSTPSPATPTIDIGITKEPYFIDKAASIDDSNVYTSASPNPEDEVEQIHLTGFDTLIRIFTPKYYPNHDPPLSALAPFLTRHRVRATVRVDKDSPSTNLRETTSGSDLSSVQGQQAYLEGIASGDLEHEGLKREWAGRVELVVDASGEAEGVSSTKVREAVKGGNWDEVKCLVGERVEEWVRQRGLYTS